MKIKFVSESIMLCILLLLVLWFFAPIVNNSTIFTTPDNYSSDITHFNYPLKYLLSDSLKHFSLPLWTNLVGTGFPLIGEGEIGAFYLPNIIVFSLFPMPLAFNIGYIITFVLLAYGMYRIGREYTFSTLTSIYCAVAFAFAGFYIVQIPHYNHLQAFSIFPFIFLCVQKIEKDHRSKAWIVLPFLLSQQIFAGHYQYVFITGVFFSLYIIMKWILNKNKFIDTFVVMKLSITLILSIGLSAIQLLPSYEYFLNSSRSGFIKLFTTSTGGLSIPHLLQTVFPFIWGSPKNGTYSLHLSGTNFWESFLYIGIVPILLALLSLLIITKEKRVKLLWVLCLCLLVLSFEGHSPFYILFSIAPLSWFRIHSRFLSVTTFTLVLLSGFTIKWIESNIAKTKWKNWTNLGIIILTALTTFEVWSFAKNYHSMENISYLTPPSSLQYIADNQKNRIYTLGIDAAWYNEFRYKGWTSMSPYQFLLNGLSPNLNILYNVPQATVYAGITLKKQQMVKDLIREHIEIDPTAMEAVISPVAQNTLELLGVTMLISAYQISQPNFVLIAHMNHLAQQLYLYKIISSKPLFYLSHRPNLVSGIKEIANDIKDTNFGKHFDSIVADDSPHEALVRSKGDMIETVIDTSTQKKFIYTSATPGYFLLLYYFYPGWGATIDGTVTPILEGNISSMALYAPPGKHTVEFFYTPKTLYTGALITGISLIGYSLWIIATVRRKPV